MGAISIFKRRITQCALALFALACATEQSQGQVVINEILFHDTSVALEVIRRYDWVELYNGNTDTVNLKGWFLTDRDLNTIYQFTDNFYFPDSAYLLVHFTYGIDDPDFSDGTASVYANPPPSAEPLPLREGAVALIYDDSPIKPDIIPASAMIDFVPWAYLIDSTDQYIPGAADTLASNAGIWTLEDVVNAANTAKQAFDRRAFVGPGFSIGRNKTSEDTNRSEDWYAHGGINASDITPWRINESTHFIAFIEDTIPPPKASWTIMIYMAGDNYLEPDMWRALNKMDLIGSPAGVNVVFQKDYSVGGSNIHVTFDNGQSWTPTNSSYRGLLKQTDDPHLVTASYPKGKRNEIDLGELNMGDPATLTDFINWVKSNYPADHYALILWGEGGGWKYSTTDEFGPGTPDEIHIKELSDALGNAGLAGEKLDLIAFDEGLMAMLEVAYQINDYAELMVASEGVLDAKGLPYDLILAGLGADPAADGNALGEIIVDSYELEAFNQWFTWGLEYSMSMIDLGLLINDLEFAVHAHAVELSVGCDDYREHYIPADNVEISIRSALKDTKNFKEGTWGDCNYIDLRHFAENTQFYVADYANFAPDVQDYVDMSVIYNKSSDPDAKGISIYFPFYQTHNNPKWQDPYDDPYRSYETSKKNNKLVKYSYDKDDGTPKPVPQGVRDHPIPPTPGFKFVDINAWDEFLHRYYEPCADAGVDTTVYVGEIVLLDGIGSSDADQFPETAVLATEYFWDFDPDKSTDTLDYDRDPMGDEDDDDGDVIGRTAYFSSDIPGKFPIVLTVWDDHHLLHGDHWETDQDTVVITVVDSLKIVGTIGLSPTCTGANDGKATVLVDGGAPPIKVTWSNGQEGTIIEGLKPGKYGYTVTDGRGTSQTGMVDVPDAVPIIIDVNNITFPLCTHEPGAIIDLAVSGGTPPYIIYWSNGATGPLLSGVIAGTYTVTVTDSNGCGVEQIFDLPAMDILAPVVTAQDAVLLLNAGCCLTLTPDMFQAVAIDNCTVDAILIEPSILDCNNLGTTTVTITAIDGSGNAASVEVLATLYDAVAPVVIAAQDVLVILGPDGYATITPDLIDAGSFDNCDIPTLTIVGITDFDCSLIGPNIVTLQATDNSGNTSTATTTVIITDTQPPVLLANDITVFLDAVGMASIQVSDILVSAVDNCGIESVTLSQYQFACSDIVWPEGIVTIDLIAIDIHGNVTILPVQVTVADLIPPLITCPADIQQQYCGPVTYPLPLVEDNCDGYSVDQISGLGSGAVFPLGMSTEIFQVADAAGNVASCSFSVTVTDSWSLTAHIQTVSCFGSADGAVSPIIVGGQEPYSYLWADGQIGATATGLSAGIATVTITDANGCSQVAQFDVPEPPLLEASHVVQDETNSQMNGQITLIGQGGTPPYAYLGQAFSDSIQLSGLSAGTYLLEISDANNCTTTTTAVVNNLVGLEVLNAVKRFAVYPVPTRQVLYIEIELTLPIQHRLRLQDVSGRMIREWPVVQTNEQFIRVDCANLTAGLYLVELQTEAGNLTRKAVIIE